MLRRVMVIAAGAALAVMALGATPRAAGAESGSALCGFNGQGNVAPPVYYQERAVNYTFTGSLSCASSDPSLNAGNVSAVGAGSIGCFRGDHNAILKVAWNNGKTSTLKIHFTDVLAVLAGSGTVADGEFAGQPVGMQLMFYSPEALNCAQTGIGAAGLSGGLQIGG